MNYISLIVQELAEPTQPDQQPAQPDQQPDQQPAQPDQPEPVVKDLSTQEDSIISETPPNETTFHLSLPSINTTNDMSTKQKNDHVLWLYSIRSKNSNCPATIIQDGDRYKTGQKQHVHPGDPGSHVAVEIKAEV
ncbi:uncharacterized protein LOC111109391 [Crassostrea virginica]